MIIIGKDALSVGVLNFIISYKRFVIFHLFSYVQNFVLLKGENIIFINLFVYWIIILTLCNNFLRIILYSSFARSFLSCLLRFLLLSQLINLFCFKILNFHFSVHFTIICLSYILLLLVLLISDLSAFSTIFFSQ